jgi:hypothetical protein
MHIFKLIFLVQLAFDDRWVCGEDLNDDYYAAIDDVDNRPSQDEPSLKPNFDAKKSDVGELTRYLEHDTNGTSRVAESDIYFAEDEDTNEHSESQANNEDPDSHPQDHSNTPANINPQFRNDDLAFGSDKATSSISDMNGDAQIDAQAFNATTIDDEQFEMAFEYDSEIEPHIFFETIDSGELSHDNDDKSFEIFNQTSLNVTTDSIDASISSPSRADTMNRTNISNQTDTSNRTESPAQHEPTSFIGSNYMVVVLAVCVAFVAITVSVFLIIWLCVKMVRSKAIPYYSTS